jgi:hypothetical protein
MFRSFERSWGRSFSPNHAGADFGYSPKQAAAGGGQLPRRQIPRTTFPASATSAIDGGGRQSLDRP